MSLYLGCPVWSFKGWAGNFYPKGTKPNQFLSEYAKRLNTIEGNTTFYAVPAIKTIANWIEQTPETFKFCAKIPKAISHNGKLVDYIDRAIEFTNVMKPLASRLGPMFLQLPPSYSSKLIEDLAKFLESFPKDVRLGVEVRHLDWFDEENRTSLNQLLTENNMARVVIDTRPIRNMAGDESIKGSTYESLIEARERKPDVPVFEEQTTDFTFLRYIGHPEMSQNTVWVEEWVKRIADQISTQNEAYVFCHTPDNYLAPYLCKEIYQRVASQVKIPELPWNGIESDVPKQANLF
ncbi:MAG: DUF72 domain-containing protein [Anaerolineales bacterium]|nr:DUF72 domain-containing protein [Anaerolineales bacterium]